MTAPRLASHIAALAILVLAGCRTVPDFVECRDDTSCDRFAGGACLVNSATGNQFCTYPDVECESGVRWSDRDVEQGISGECMIESASNDAGVDGTNTITVDAAALDANTDAAVEPPPDVFDVGYVSEWRLGTSATTVSQYEWVRVVNKGSAPLDLATAQIVSVTDNHSQIVLNMTWRPLSTILQPGYSAGALTPAASSQVVGGGLVTEPAQNTIDGLVHLSVTNLPPSGTWLVVDGEATLRIGTARATLNVRVTSSGTGSAATPYSGARAQSSPVP